jgi:mono/diheme cytochrome c family protein
MIAARRKPVRKRWAVFGLLAAGSLASALVVRARADTPASGSVNRGAAIVARSSCMGCHGANFAGGSLGPKLYGIERVRSTAQIAAAIASPRPPMPREQFSDADVADIVAYISALDGGLDDSGIRVAISPAVPSMRATVTVTFLKGLPKVATVQALMHMSTFTHGTNEIPMVADASASALRADLSFSMAGPWVVVVRYDGEERDVPIFVSGQR